MTEIQVLTIALANIPAALLVLAAILFNNNRLSDFREFMGKRIDGLADVMRTEMAKNQSEILSKFAEIDHRIERLEFARWKP